MSGQRPAAARGAPAYLVRGDDPALVAQAARALVARLVAGRDPALVVEEHGNPPGDDLDVGAVVDACTTPPFLGDRRVVVVRDAGRLTADDATRLVAYLQEPLPTTVLVLVAGGGTVPPALVRAVGAAGEVVDTAVGTGRERQGWLTEHVRDAPVRLSPQAARQLGDHLGDDLGRLAGILQTLAAAYGRGAHVGPEELEPYLGEAGSVPPWALTDAVDAGATADALAALHRLLGPGGRAVPEVLAVLHRHFSNMLRLDGANARSGEDAARLLGVRSPFVASKALSQCQRLGTDRIAQAMGLLAAADLDVKGRSGLPPEVVLEILVARLSRLAPRAAARSRRSMPSPAGRP
ncbi:MAG TPA: DNA polymerase III subunit delta [Acidimicrobiales bacterium]|nr:DNA polymerase III subunit delta [Acidimicrobiales bacterium]